ncbi:MAG TPA: two-component system sensor histidine kinase NtrB [Candidatus Hypogeohydataceae bacterium YC41]
MEEAVLSILCLLLTAYCLLFMTDQDRYKIVFEKGPDAIVLINSKGLVKEANILAQQLYCFTREELLHRPIPTLPEDLKQEFFRLLEKVKEGEKVVDWETKRLNKSKKTLEVSVSISFVEDSNGGLFVESARDVSGRISWREKMLEVERLAALGKLSASLAHQLNTPLAVALLKVEKIRGDIHGNDALSSEVETLKESLQTLKLSVQNTLGFARKPVQQRWPVELNSLLKGVCQFYEAAFRHKQVRCTPEVSGTEGVRLHANPTEIETAISCLLMNSLEALPKGGEIKLSSRILNLREVEVVVEDNGPGIPMEVFPHIFEPFYTTKKLGTGLGLPIVKRVVEEHGGYILVESQEGKGVAVSVRLPYLRN